jgi:hypothetical protein
MQGTGNVRRATLQNKSIVINKIVTTFQSEKWSMKVQVWEIGASGYPRQDNTSVSKSKAM